MHHSTFDLVWLGVLILTPGVGVPAGPVCPAFPLRFRLGLSAGGRVRPVGFKSVADLIGRINDYVANWYSDCKPFNLDC